MYARVYDCGQIVIKTHDQDQDQDQDTTGTQDTTGRHHRKREDSGKAEKPTYMGKIADDEKKYKKKLRKIWKCKKPAVSL